MTGVGPSGSDRGGGGDHGSGPYHSPGPSYVNSASEGAVDADSRSRLPSGDGLSDAGRSRNRKGRREKKKAEDNFGFPSHSGDGFTEAFNGGGGGWPSGNGDTGGAVGGWGAGGSDSGWPGGSTAE